MLFERNALFRGFIDKMDENCFTFFSYLLLDQTVY